jgi:drug/metabolite transporter (DMT)-like permease
MADSDGKVGSLGLATAGGFCALLLWSTTIALARGLSEQVGPVTAAAAVFIVSSIGALAALLRSGGKRREILRLPISYLVGCGALFTGYMLLLFLAVGLADGRQQVLEVGLVNYLWPAFTLLLSLPLLKKRASWILLPATLLALAGLVLVVTQGAPLSWRSLAGNLAGNPAVYALALSAALSWALYSNLTRKWAGGREQGAVTLFLPVTALALILICLVLDEPREWSGRALAEALFLGAATYVAYALWDNAMRRGNVVLVAAASYLTPLISTIVSCLYLAVVPGARLWVGCVVLILGSALSWLSVKERGRKIRFRFEDEAEP